MKDKYFLLNGRSYPDTVTSGPLGDAVRGWRESFLTTALPAIIKHSSRQKGSSAHF